jgi:2-oxoglutarate ferredoxin oxidoreductase subunit alpha
LIDLSSLDKFVRKLSNKILKHKEEITIVERDYVGAEVVLVSYGPVARAAATGAQLAREAGMPAGTLRLVTLWPFPDHEIERMAKTAKHVIVLENNLGQMYPYVKAAAAPFANVSFLPPRLVGQIQDPEDILARIREVVR